MKIHLRHIHSDGLRLEGEEEISIPEFEAAGVRCTGPLRYALDLGISEGALWASGAITQPVELQCVRCLEAFAYAIDVPAFSLHLELTGPEEIDLAPNVREDILLNLPAHPHCDREGGQVCQAEKLVRADAEKSGAEGKPQPDWSALDKLKLS